MKACRWQIQKTGRRWDTKEHACLGDCKRLYAADALREGIKAGASQGHLSASRSSGPFALSALFLKYS